MQQKSEQRKSGLAAGVRDFAACCRGAAGQGEPGTAEQIARLAVADQPWRPLPASDAAARDMAVVRMINTYLGAKIGWIDRRQLFGHGIDRVLNLLLGVA